MNAWFGALAITVATIIGSWIFRGTLRLAGKHERWVFLQRLAPSLSNLIYIFGLRAAIDLLPLEAKALNWVDGGAYILAVLILLGLARKALLLALEWSVSYSIPSKTLQLGFIPLLRNIVTLFIFLTGGIMVLKHFNYDVMSLLTALGVGSLAVGLAAKDTLSNMISGFTLIIDRNLKPGDRINLGGSIGDVEEIGLRSTRIRTGDGNTLIVPNSELVNTKILNLSIPESIVATSVVLRLPFTVPFEKVRSHCLSALEEVTRARKERGFSVTLTSLHEGHQVVTVSFWVGHLDEQGGAQSDFNERILRRLNQEQIPLVIRNSLA